MKGKTRLTNSIAYYNEMTGWVDERRAVGVLFSMAFNAVSHSILIENR